MATQSLCHECGAPLKNAAPAQDGDSAVHADLAQANLFRVRGELDAAEKKCLSILKRYPNEPEAHSLLGDLSADKGDWGRAIEWYELALDLSPSSATDKAKLDEAKRHLEANETAETVEQLGIPEHTSRTPWIVGGVAALLVVIVLIAIVKGPTARPVTPPPVHGGVISASPSNTPIVVDQDQTSPAKVDTSDQPSTDTKPVAAVTSAPYESMDDRTIQQQLQQHSMYGNLVTGVEVDPRDKVLTVTYTVPAGEDARKLGATLAKDSLDQSQDTLLVTVRGIAGDHLAFVADSSRPKLMELESGTPNLSSDSWISGFMQREWPAPATASATPASASTTGTPGAGSASTPATTGTAGQAR